jgi:hypothetical protein
MDHDFLDGIDEKFQSLMALQGKNGRSRSKVRNEDRWISQISDLLEGFSTAQKEQVLAFVQSLKQKAGPG